MNKRIWISLTLSALFLLTGCWDRAELPEKGFVMGIALDQASGGKISLTTQVFKPSQGVGAIGGKSAAVAFANVTTIDNSVPRAIRDIPINLGRKAQWSHTRLIIIAEKLASEREIYDLLEFFFRDHEPRLTISIMIAEGRADQYLNMKPLIENTISQQLFQSEKSSAMNTAKTMDVDLLTLGKQMKSEVGNAMVPYLYLSKDSSSKFTNTAGIAMIKNGKFAGVMEPGKVEILQMLLNQYQSGMIDIPCHTQSTNNQKVDTVEVVSLKSKWHPTLIGEQAVKVPIKVKINVAAMELACSQIEKKADEKKFAQKIEEAIKQRIVQTTDWLRKNKFDALGLGNKVYQKNPALWKRWKNSWGDRFANTEFNVDVEVKVINSGTNIGKPVFEK